MIGLRCSSFATKTIGINEEDHDRSVLVHLAQDEVNQHRRLVGPPKPGATTYLLMRSGVERKVKNLPSELAAALGLKASRKASAFEV